MSHKKTPPPTIEESVQEAAQVTLGKRSKVEAMTDAVFLQSLHGYSQGELDSIERYREMKVFGNSDPGPSRSQQQPTSGDLIVCDDMHFQFPEQPKQNPLLPLAMLLGGGAIGLGSLWAAGNLLKPSTTKETTIEKTVESPPSKSVHKTFDWRAGPLEVIPPENQ